MIDITLVKSASPVEDKASFLYRWDSLVRSNFVSNEANLTVLRQGLNALYTNPATKFRDPVQFAHRYQELEAVRLRQQLG